ncbi:hypothetical protein [Candidatus Borrarchaeum sp.]|uniref:hypothetical protein n=1 Tax=Candidatus Borrarchaeum sp. TaxID=2846742 RepID=UPI00257990D0|nr:hypothetical protein [Candidatus Borrarchaeum sp.]
MSLAKIFIRILSNQKIQKLGLSLISWIKDSNRRLFIFLVPLGLINILVSILTYQKYFLSSVIFLCIPIALIIVVIILSSGSRKYSNTLTKKHSSENILLFLNIGKYTFLDRITDRALKLYNLLLGLLVFVLLLRQIVNPYLGVYMNIFIPNEFLEMSFYVLENIMIFLMILIMYSTIKDPFRPNPQVGSLYCLLGIDSYLEDLIKETPTLQKAKVEWDKIIEEEEKKENSNKEIKRFKKFGEIIFEGRELKSEEDKSDFAITLRPILLSQVLTHPLRVRKSRETEKHTILLEEFYRYMKGYFSYYDSLLEEGEEFTNCIGTMYLIIKYGNLEERKELSALLYMSIIYLMMDMIPETLECFSKIMDAAPRLSNLKGIVNTHFEKIKPWKEPFFSTSNILTILIFFGTVVFAILLA